MATAQQRQALELIEQKRQQAKEKKLKLANYLSGGQKNVKTAINAIISVGALSIVSGCICCIWAIYGLATMLYQGVTMSPLDWTLAISEFVVYIATISIGIKLYRLNITPIFALVSLIIMLAMNAVFFMSILPCLTVIFSIIGIICWNTYKNWFNSIMMAITKKQKVKEKAIVSETHPKVQASKKTSNNESQSQLPWIIAITTLCLLTIGGSVGFYFLGRSQGYDSGHSEGYSAGSSAGYKSGFSGGEAAGQSYGYNKGYDEGYNKGYNDMWSKCMCIVSGGGGYCS